MRPAGAVSATSVAGSPPTSAVPHPCLRSGLRRAAVRPRRHRGPRGRLVRVVRLRRGGDRTAASWTASMPGQERTGPRTYTGTRITRAGDIRYEHDAAGRIVLRRKTGCHANPTPGATPGTPSTASPASSPRDGTRWRYLYDPLGRRTAKQRPAPDGVTVAEQTAFTWDGNRQHPLRTDHDLHRPAPACPARSSSPGTTPQCGRRPGPNASPRPTLPGRSGPAPLPHRHRPRRHTDRTRRRVRRHRPALAHQVVGYDHVVVKLHRPPVALPRSVLRSGNRSARRLLPPLRPGDHPVEVPKPYRDSIHENALPQRRPTTPTVTHSPDRHGKHS